MGELDGKIAVITGAGSGMARAFARAFGTSRSVATRAT
jgi:NAD(P)-dependent dehydrogenase (short-subunit alcohol dehydrogenase family)